MGSLVADFLSCSPLVFEKGRGRWDRKDNNYFFLLNDALLSVGERGAFMKLLSLSDSLYDSASWCLPSSRQIVNVT